MEINEGDIVWLKTGGPAMTVKHIRNDGNWQCSWFVGTDVSEHNFTTKQLIKENPKP